MRKLLFFGAIIVLLGVLIGVYNSEVSPSAARVDGAVVPQQTLNAALVAISHDPGYQCIVGNPPTTGQSAQSYNSTFTADVLQVLIEQRVLENHIAAFGLSTGNFALGVARSEIESELTPGQGSSCHESGAQSYDQLGPTYRGELVSFQEDQDALAGHLAGVHITSSAITAYQAAHRASTQLSCLGVVEVASQAKAASLVGQLRAGGDFAAIARANSLDTGSAANGGSLGCIDPNELPSPINADAGALAVGGISNPISYTGAWLILRLASHQAETLQQVAMQVISGTAKPLSTALDSLVRRADVVVDPAYGRWGTISGSLQVIPRTAPPASLLTTAPAVQPTASSGS